MAASIAKLAKSIKRKEGKILDLSQQEDPTQIDTSDLVSECSLGKIDTREGHSV
jgi:hypothetical protein